MADLADLAASVDCAVALGKDPAWAAELTGFNVAEEHRPDLIVAAQEGRDVADAVRWAAKRGLPVGVQATGHGLFDPTTAGVLISTRRMTGIRLDAERQLATVQAGVRWRAVIDAAAPHGLAPLSGSSSQVGVIGYTLGGGVGLLARRFGFAADLVSALTIVTADGSMTRIDADHEPDLFWAIRGGKSGFGIVTELEFRLLAVPVVYGASMFFSGSAALDVLHMYREWAPSLPDEATTSVAILCPPNDTGVAGAPVVHLRYVYCGAVEIGAALIRPMLTSGPVLASDVGPMPFTSCDDIHRDPEGPLPIRERTCQLTSITADLVELLASLPERAAAGGAALFVCEIRQLGGALGREPEVPNAVAGRGGAYSLLTLGVPGPTGRDGVDRLLSDVMGAVDPWRGHGALLNWVGNAAREEVAAAWPAATLDRLSKVRAAADPTRLFRFGHGV